MAFDLATSVSPAVISETLSPDVYYIEVGTDRHAYRTDFRISGTFVPDPTPPPKVVTRPPSKPKPNARPKPQPQPVPKPTPAVVVPPPPQLAEPGPETAMLLRHATTTPAGESATTTSHEYDPVKANVGTASGVRWRWYRVDLAKRSNATLTVRTDGPPVHVAVWDDARRKLLRSFTTTPGGSSQTVEHGPGTLWVRVGPSPENADSRVSIVLSVAERDPRAMVKKKR
jgi:hypothetical protein